MWFLVSGAMRAIERPFIPLECASIPMSGRRRIGQTCTRPNLRLVIFFILLKDGLNDGSSNDGDRAVWSAEFGCPYTAFLDDSDLYGCPQTLDVATI